MPSIKFSHPYRKLFTEPQRLGDKAKLLQILRADFSELTAEFVEYDTDNGKYKLPKEGPCIVLLFQKRTPVPHLFTTVRPCTPDKLEYYRGMIGEVVDLQVTL